MKGTEKQIAWAQQIKAAMKERTMKSIPMLQERAEKYRRKAAGDPEYAEAADELLEYVEWLGRIDEIDDASWFIDNRGYSFGTPVAQAMAQAIAKYFRG